MEKLLDKGISKLFNGLTKFTRNHPIISYAVSVVPACVMLAAGYVSIKAGFYETPEGKKGE